ncbi:MAG TPA: divalent-cation tolerance protein CutA [Pirellulales bacterium]|nr:divalent-cation tolerance protein CutA [Pirellulales bacterium]
MTDYIQVYLTTPTPEAAQAIAERLLAERLAACVQIGGPIESRYRWQGKMEISQEWHCTVKSRLDLFPRIEAAVRSLHPYDVPEILATTLVAGHAEYLAWLDQELLPDHP